MLQVNWKLVEEKVDELYPRYEQGMRYSELEAELKQQNFDQNHINAIAEALEKRYRDAQSKRVSIPLVVFSVVVAIIFVVGIALIFLTGNIIIAAVGAGLFFMVMKLILGRKSGKLRTQQRWRGND